MNTVEVTDANYILYFGGGILAVVLLTGIVVGISSIIWAWNNRSTGKTLEAKQLHFAAATLTGLGLIFVLSMAMNLWGGAEGQDVFEACKTIIPPIITLILGYYFGKEKPNQPNP